MGLVYAEIELTSVDDLVLHRRGFLPADKIKRMTINALVDTGAYMLVINDHIRQQLDLPFIEEQVFRLADDSEIRGEVVGPVEIRFENRRTSVDAVVLAVSEPLLGSIPLEDLDVVVDPRRQQLIVNPASPHIATKYLKKLSTSDEQQGREGMSTVKPDQISNQPVDDRGTNESEGRTILKRLRDNGFDGSDERLAVALGRPVGEVEGWTGGVEPVDDDVIMKARGIAKERGIEIE